MIVIVAIGDVNDSFIDNNGGLALGQGEANPVRLRNVRHTSDDIHPENLSINIRPLRKFCVSVFRHNQEYHVFKVHGEGLFPLSTALPAGWGGMRAGTA